MTLFGSVPYLNARPLLETLEALSGEAVFLAPPAELHQAMQRGEVEIALLPVMSYLEEPSLRLIPGTGIISRGPVQSVLAFHRDRESNLENTPSVYLDPHSKTSQQLLQVLIKKKYQRDLSEINWTPHFEEAETYLLIGDAALLHRQHNPHFNDLGQEWDRLTGLPFVYACWMSRHPVEPKILDWLQHSKGMAKENLLRICQQQEMIDTANAFEYLSHCIHYQMGGPELIGLKLFLDWVAEIKDGQYETSLKFITETRTAAAVND